MKFGGGGGVVRLWFVVSVGVIDVAVRDDDDVVTADDEPASSSLLLDKCNDELSLSISLDILLDVNKLL